MNKDEMMDKYEGLILILRNLAKTKRQQRLNTSADVMEEAAYAIEELREQNDNLREVADTANEYAEHLRDIKRHESCIDCPLYDKDNHRCPRFNAVIPKAIEESKRAQCVESVGVRWVPSAEPERKKLFEKLNPIGTLYKTLRNTGSPEEKGLPGKWEYKGSTMLSDIWERVE